MFEAERQRHNLAEIETQVVAERELMGNVDSYMSAFHFLRRIQERYNDVDGQSKHIKFVPENSMKSAFIRIDETSVEPLKNLLLEDDEGLPTNLEDILSTKAKNTRRNGNLGKSFQTDGVQVKLQHVVISERLEWVTVRQANYNYALRYSVLEHAYIKQNRQNLLDEGYRMDGLSRLSSKSPSYMTDNRSERSKSCSFREATSGIFSKDSAYRTEGLLPEIIYSCDPGIKNVWCISKYNTNPNLIDERRYRY